jgi:rhamnogalacturonan endolyase
MLLPQIAAWASAFSALVGAITITEGTNSYTVATEDSANFTVTIATTDGSITSILYGGEQYQYAGSGSQVASGLLSATVTYEATGKFPHPYQINYLLTCTKDDYVVVAAAANNANFTLTQYYVFQDGVSAIFLATNTTTEPTVGEQRFLFRLVNLPDSYPEGNVSSIYNGTAIEASDVYLVGDETRSKVRTAWKFIQYSRI